MDKRDLKTCYTGKNKEKGEGKPFDRTYCWVHSGIYKEKVKIPNMGHTSTG